MIRNISRPRRSHSDTIRIGPAFVKVGKSVLYPASELDIWDEKNVVMCSAARVALGPVSKSLTTNMEIPSKG